ncbi:hypothetical protein D021_1382B, partial [Vibrio parahaemolyticus 10296]
SPFKSTL